MSDQQHSSQGFLKEKMEDYRVNPPDQLWDSIAARLGGRGRRRMIIFSLSAAASLALAVTLGITFFDRGTGGGTEIAATPEQGVLAPAEDTGTSPGMLAQPQETLALPESRLAAREGTRAGKLEKEVIRSLHEIASETPEAVAPSQVLREPVALAMETEEITDTTGLRRAVEASPREAGTGPGKPDSAELPDREVPVPEPGEKTAGEDPALDLLPEIQVQKREDPRWIVGAALSPLYSFRDAESNAMAGAADLESGVIAYAGGVHVSYRAASRLAIETGIFYNKMGVAIGASGIQSFNNFLDFTPLAQEGEQTSVRTITNSIGNIVATSGEIYVNNYKLNAASGSNTFLDNTSGEFYVSEQGIRQHLDYLELPFNLRYSVVDRTVEIQLVGGISTNFLVNNYVTMETASGTSEIGYLTNIRSVNYSGNAGVGMVYHVHEKISLRLEPRFRYFLNSVNDTSLPATRPFALGFYTGLSYTF